MVSTMADIKEAWRQDGLNVSHEQLAQAWADLRSVCVAKTERIKELEDENYDLRDSINSARANETELPNTVDYLSDLLNLIEEDEYRAELIGREVDADLARRVREETDKLLTLVTPLIGALS